MTTMNTQSPVQCPKCKQISFCLWHGIGSTVTCGFCRARFKTTKQDEPLDVSSGKGKTNG